MFQLSTAEWRNVGLKTGKQRDEEVHPESAKQQG